jgi:protein-S-isoprenylcysteine O-methyltransferase Ste14
MRPFVLHDPSARILFFVCVYGWLAAEFVLRLSHGKGRQRQFDPSTLPIVVSIWVGIGLAFSLDHVRWASFDGGWRWASVGLVLLVAGAALRLWAIQTLGRLFTYYVSIQEGHEIVRNGPYRFVRHPSYTGGLVGLLGIGVCLESWLSMLVIVLVPLAGILVRIRVEERRLAAAFGEEYERYAAGRQRLIPHVW